MNSYTAENTLRLAKRRHNTKRSYLLVNPLQAKHIPVSPGESLKMMYALGTLLKERHGGARLVIGFAETATAIGAAAAASIGEGCRYIHTTREECPGTGDWVYFREEHSHAVEQKLSTAQLGRWIDESPEIVFVDDEISTGKTLLNIVEQLRAAFPGLEGRAITALSVISRLSEENKRRFEENGIGWDCLVSLEQEDLTERVARYEIGPAAPAEGPVPEYESVVLSEPLPDPRMGLEISSYCRSCRSAAEELREKLGDKLRGAERVLVLGSEECMFPSLILGRELEERDGLKVLCHSSTRSPIGICGDEDYPIHSGYALRSMYEAERSTFIYNLSPCDAAIVLSDSPASCREGRDDLAAALSASGCGRIIFAEGGKNVQQL